MIGKTVDIISLMDMYKEAINIALMEGTHMNRKSVALVKVLATKVFNKNFSQKYILKLYFSDLFILFSFIFFDSLRGMVK